MSDVLLPLKMVQDFQKDFPFEIDMWDFIDNLLKTKRKDNIVWDEKCYIPSTILFSYLHESITKTHNKPLPKHLVKILFSEARKAAMLAHWRQFKEVYRFDNEMIELLYEASDTWENGEIPSALFEYMPFPCFFIEQKFEFIVDNKPVNSAGFMVYFNDEPSNHSTQQHGEVLYFYFKLDTGAEIYLPFDIKNGETISYKLGKLLESNQSIDEANLLENAVRAMQLAVYICSQNADIDENPIQRNIIRRKEKVILDKFREVRIWDVGERIGNSIRLFKANENSTHTLIENNPAPERNRPRPHVRRAHWRVYREGVNGRTKTKAIFIHEQTINTKTPNDITAIVHKHKL